MAPKSGAQRQKEYRIRKKTQGRYITIFVPTEIAEKVEGRPNVLAEYFLKHSQLIEIIVKKDKETMALRKLLKEIMGKAGRMEKELAKVYNREKLRELYNVHYGNDHQTKEIQTKIDKLPASLDVLRKLQLNFRIDVGEYSSKLKHELLPYRLVIQRTMEELNELVIDKERFQEREEIDIKKVKSLISWFRKKYSELSKRKEEFDKEERHYLEEMLEKY
jgi:hypothetical protein